MMMKARCTDIRSTEVGPFRMGEGASALHTHKFVSLETVQDISFEIQDDLRLAEVGEVVDLEITITRKG